MTTILADDFVNYKEGFNEARELILKDYRLGRESTLEDKYSDNLWRAYGYNDGYYYYSSLIKTKAFDIEGLETLNDIQECFTRRISALNETEESRENAVNMRK